MAAERILIVEDEQEISQVVCLFLQEEGYAAETVSNGTQCLESVAADPPDLIILDIALPDLDGWEVMDQLNRSGHRIPILITSASEHAGRKLVGFELAPHLDHIVKPFDSDDFLMKVEALLGSSREYSSGDTSE